jgi:hypothetical protein
VRRPPRITRHLYSVVAISIALVASACVSGGALNRQRFEGVRRAGHAIRESIGANAKLPRYQELLVRYADELSKLKEVATGTEEKLLLARYDALYAQLEDIRLVWEARTTHAAETDRLPLSDPLSARLAEQYRLPINTNEPPSIYATEALNAIWSAAKEALDGANAALDGSASAH